MSHRKKTDFTLAVVFKAQMIAIIPDGPLSTMGIVQLDKFKSG